MAKPLSRADLAWPSWAFRRWYAPKRLQCMNAGAPGLVQGIAELADPLGRATSIDLLSGHTKHVVVTDRMAVRAGDRIGVAPATHVCAVGLDETRKRKDAR